VQEYVIQFLDEIRERVFSDTRRYIRKLNDLSSIHAEQPAAAAYSKPRIILNTWKEGGRGGETAGKTVTSWSVGGCKL
jgi:hypothetical protein